MKAPRRERFLPDHLVIEPVCHGLSLHQPFEDFQPLALDARPPPPAELRQPEGDEPVQLFDFVFSFRNFRVEPGAINIDFYAGGDAGGFLLDGCRFLFRFKSRRRIYRSNFRQRQLASCISRSI